MNIHNIEVLLAVADCGSTTIAGEKLGLTQSRTTQIVKAVEKELGVTMLQKKQNRGVVLTSEGETLIPALRNLAADYEDFRQEIASIQNLKRGRLKIGTAYQCPPVWISSFVKAFSGQYPNIRVEIAEGTQKEMENAVKERRVDLAIMTFFRGKTLEFIPILREQIVAVFPRGSVLEKFDKVTDNMLQYMPIILYETSAEDRQYERIFRNSGFTPEILLKTRNDLTALSMVDQGLGISILPESVCKSFTGNVVYRPFDPDINRTLGIATKSSRDTSPATQAFIDTIRESFAQGIS